MTEKPKPAKAPSAWRGKPHAIDMEYGKMKEPTVPYRPNLTMRVGSALFDWLRGRR